MTQTSKHTPGPWTVFYKPKYDEWHVSVPRAPGGGMKLALFADGCPTGEHDARLIAAAPDLLAAIKVAVQLAEVASDWNLDEVEIDGEMVRTHDLAERFRAAIAKAEGSSHA